jgi:hypothetical protein
VHVAAKQKAEALGGKPLHAIQILFNRALRKPRQLVKLKSMNSAPQIASVTPAAVGVIRLCSSFSTMFAGRKRRNQMER